MNNNKSDFLDKFISFYDPVKQRIGNIGVLAAGFVLIVLSFFVRTDIFGLLLDLLGAIGILSGILICVIGFVMLGIEKGWWNGPGALGGETESPSPQYDVGAPYHEGPAEASPPTPPPPAAPTGPTAPAAPVTPTAPPSPITPAAPAAPVGPTTPAAPVEPPYQPPYAAPPPAQPYGVPYQQPYGTAAYPPPPPQGGLPLPAFVVRNQGNILFAILAIFLGTIVWGFLLGIVGGFAAVLSPELYIDLVTALGGIPFAAAASVGTVGAGIIGGIVAYETGKAVKAALIFLALNWALTLLILFAVFAFSASLDYLSFLSAAPNDFDSISMFRTMSEYFEYRDTLALRDIGFFEYVSMRMPFETFALLVFRILLTSFVIPTAALLIGAIIGARLDTRRSSGVSV